MPPGPSTSARGRDETGATMIELVVLIGLAGVMAAIAFTGWQTWTRASEHEGAATEIVAVLRQAQQRAVTEGSSVCVEFSTAQGSWTVFRGTCSSATRTRLEGPVALDSPRVRIAAAGFTSGPGATGPGVTFSSRGTATPGGLELARDGSSTRRTVSVEGLTGRVTTS
jgi:Tfp pilus assembly protein FimT